MDYSTEDRLKYLVLEMARAVSRSNDYSPIASQLYRMLCAATGTVTGVEQPDWSLLEAWNPQEMSFAAYEEQSSQPLRDQLGAIKRQIETDGEVDEE